jgi:hypothetical protein
VPRNLDDLGRESKPGEQRVDLILELLAQAGCRDS